MGKLAEILISGVLALAVLCGIVLMEPAMAQTFTVLHNFSNGADGGLPQTGTVDAAGNFYGTAPQGGQRGPDCQVLQCGLVFKLSERNSQWTLTPIYSFAGGTDGWHPNAGLIFGPDGALYGTTVYGGTGICPDCYCAGCGTVYRLRPQPSRCTSVLCTWRETVLYSFTEDNGAGLYPSGGVTFDTAGNMYGPTRAGGSPGFCGQTGCGVIYKMTQSNGQWTQSPIYDFSGGFNGGEPNTPIVFDDAGNIFGTAAEGGMYGSIYELSPSGSDWVGSIIHRFTRPSDGQLPIGLLFHQGNLFGTTTTGGDEGGGFVYELSQNGGQWVLNPLQNFAPDGFEPTVSAPMISDPQGNLYGTSLSGGQFGKGSVFKLTPSGGSWIYTSLHDFNGTDGTFPTAVVMDTNGNLFGTCWGGGTFNFGTAFKIILN